MNEHVEAVRLIREALESTQWGNEHFDPESGSDGTLYKLCPLCDQSEERGHAPDCTVDRALDALPALERMAQDAERWRAFEGAQQKGERHDDIAIPKSCNCRGCNPMNWPESNGWHCSKSRRELDAARAQEQPR